MNENMEIDQDLLEFLESGKKLDYDYTKAEPGYVGLCKVNDLKLGSVWIEGPDKGESYYNIPAVSLTNESEFYNPKYILLWLPNEKEYGTWDCDHWNLFTFEGVSWQDISKNPLPFINCQWDRNQSVGSPFDPKGRYTLLKGWPF